MSFALALAIAASWWGGHGVTIPCHPIAVPVTDAQMTAWGIPGAVTAAYPASLKCEVYVAPRASAWMKEPALESDYCNAVAHEFGNLAGLPETDDEGLLTDRVMTIGGRGLWSCDHWRGWRRKHWGY